MSHGLLIAEQFLGNVTHASRNGAIYGLRVCFLIPISGAAQQTLYSKSSDCLCAVPACTMSMKDLDLKAFSRIQSMALLSLLVNQNIQCVQAAFSWANFHLASWPHAFMVTLHPERLDQLLRCKFWRAPSMASVCVSLIHQAWCQQPALLATIPRSWPRSRSFTRSTSRTMSSTSTEWTL